MEVAIIGAGWNGFKSCIPDLSFQEMIYEAAVRAYADANIDPRAGVDAFVSAEEDYWAGYSIYSRRQTRSTGGGPQAHMAHKRGLHPRPHKRLHDNTQQLV